MAVKDVLRDFSLPPYGMPYPEGTYYLPPQPPNAWMANAGDMPQWPDFPFTAEAEIKDGKLFSQSHEGYKIEGKLTAEGGDALTISGDAPAVNGIVVRSGKCCLNHLQADVKGDGLNDFDGIGAVVMSTDEGVVELRDSVITTAGVIRPCTFAAEKGTLKVYNCTLNGEGGYVEPDYVPIPGPGMRKAPLGLKIDGTSRTHLSVGNSHTYFYNTKIIADGWAAISTDGCTDELYVEANDCDIVCRNVGYGVYSDGGCIVRLNNCRINTASHSAIMAGECKLSYDGCTAQSGKYGVMMHAVMGSVEESSKLYIKNTSMIADELPLFVRSTNAYIGIDNSQVITKSGVLFRSVYNDDAMMTRVGDEDNEIYGIKLSVQKSALKGDILHEDPQRTMAVKLTDATLEGKIEKAYITFSGNSKWLATADSHVSLVDVSDLSSLDALPNVTIYAVCGAYSELSGTHTLPSGGRLVVE